jgi:hypothetical protein
MLCEEQEPEPAQSGDRFREKVGHAARESPHVIDASAVMITLYAYPMLFGVADNTGHG